MNISWFYRGYLYCSSNATLADINYIANHADKATWVYIKTLGKSQHDNIQKEPACILCGEIH